jgi:SWI/SNF-related matrix-associated actin-dependent regulator 1 of chromatin subfamily A
MQVDFADGRYVVRCTFEERFIPKAAGFQWDPAVKRWVTESTGVAVSTGVDNLTERARATLGLDRAVPVPEGLAYLPFQSEGIAYGLARSRTLIADQPGLGKGHPVSTPLLTPGGWKPIGDLQYGDAVIGWFGEPIPVTGIFDRGILPVYTVEFNDGASIKCDGDHLWTVFIDDAEGGHKQTVDTLRLITKFEAGEQMAIPTLLGPAKMIIKHFPVAPLVAGVDLATTLCAGLDTHFRYAQIKTYDIRSYALGAPHQAQEFLNGVISAVGRIRGDDGHIRVDVTTSPEGFHLVETITDCVRKLGGLVFKEDLFRRARLRIYLPENVAYPVFGYPVRTIKIMSRWKDFQPGAPARLITNIFPSGREQVRCIKVDGPGSLYVAEHCIVTHNTIQTIGIMNGLPQLENALIIPPASLKKNWLKEMTKWLVNKNLSIDIAEGNSWPNSNIVIVNYDILHRHREKLRERKWNLVSPDEHHYAKNRDSGRSKELHGGLYTFKAKAATDTTPAVKKHAIRVEAIPAERLVMLSGTPLANRTGDLWTSVHAADPNGLGRDYYEFHKRYCGAYYGPYGEFIPNGEPTKEMQAELNRLLKERFMIRRLKRDVLSQLPEKIRQIVPLPADGLKNLLAEERRAMTDLLDMYEKMIGVRKEMADEDIVKAMFRIKPETWELYAKMVDGDAASVQMPLSRLAQARQDLAIAKIPMVAEYVGNLMEQGVKVGVFGYHQAVIEGLRDKFPNAAVIYGKTPQNSTRNPDRTRQAQADRFQEDDSCHLFIGQYTAAGTGWTLTAGNHFVAAELTYVPHELLQAEDRFHRIGSEIHDSVWAHHLVVEGSLDDHMIMKLIHKMEIIERTLD